MMRFFACGAFWTGAVFGDVIGLETVQAPVEFAYGFDPLVPVHLLEFLTGVRLVESFLLLAEGAFPRTLCEGFIVRVWLWTACLFFGKIFSVFSCLQSGHVRRLGLVISRGGFLNYSGSHVIYSPRLSVLVAHCVIHLPLVISQEVDEVFELDEVLFFECLTFVVFVVGAT